ncbi:MAG: hypothetical protein ACFCGT_03005 [Sandaracinaceae bacterium]
MSLLPSPIDELLARPTPIEVVAVDGEEGLFPALLVAMGLADRGHSARVRVEGAVGAGVAQIDAARSYLRAQRVPVSVEAGTPGSAPLTVLALGGARRLVGAEPRVGHGAEPDAPKGIAPRPPPARRRVVALVAAGAEAAFDVAQDAVDAALARLVGHGGLLGVDALRRFDRLARTFLELSEEVSHAVGPEAQNLVADTLRAALFGRSGRVPVNLACRDRPPRIGPLTTLILWLDPVEVWPPSA